MVRCDTFPVAVTECLIIKRRWLNKVGKGESDIRIKFQKHEANSLDCIIYSKRVDVWCLPVDGFLPREQDCR